MNNGVRNNGVGSASEGTASPVGGDPVITVEGVSKRFIVQERAANQFREKLAARLRLGKAREVARPREFWALQDVSFTVAPGQTVGIVGHNGSGKSTMLKLLTSILAPTRGSVRVHGRVGALIEVGAGFHPDLSGRENVYLNGSILGLTRRQIDDRFERIVDFAGLQGFIDTPVKRYSSGMYMRLGFSIAAHTDPDVLLIDEVLAVGDTLFQRKCIRHLQEFVARGGAAVFVSHSMSQVAELCDTCVWLDHGQLRFVGPTTEAIDQYLAVVTERENADLMRTHPDEWAALEAEKQATEERLRAEEQEREEAERREAERRGALEKERAFDPHHVGLLGVTLRNSRGVAATRFPAGESLKIEISYRFGPELPDPIIGVDFVREDGTHMFTTSNYDHKVSFRDLPEEGVLTLDVAMLCLFAGQYRIRVNLFGRCDFPDWWRTPFDEIAEAVRFEVTTATPGSGSAFLPTQWNLPSSEATAPAGRESVSIAVAIAEPLLAVSEAR